jgi:hypothetical protein
MADEQLDAGSPDMTATEQMLAETGMKKSDTDPDRLTPQDESPVLDKSDEASGEQDNRPDHDPDTQQAPSLDDGTDWKKRHGDAVRWAQQIKAEKERLEQQLRDAQTWRQRYQEAGLDFDEIDRFIEGQSGGTPQRRQDMDTSAPKNSDGNYVTADQLNNIVTRYNYDMAKRDFADANPDFRDSDALELLDVEAQKIAYGYIQQYGSVTAPVDEIVKEAAKKVTAKVNKFKTLGAKSVTEKREKIKEAALPEGESVKKGSSDDSEDVAYSKHDYVKMQNQHRTDIMRRGRR